MKFHTLIPISKSPSLTSSKNQVFMVPLLVSAAIQTLSPITIITLASPGCSLILLPTSLTPLHIIFPSRFHFLSHTLASANTLFLVCSERSNSKSTCGPFFFPCLRPRAPKHCLRSPPPPHSPITPPTAPYNSLPLCSLLMDFSPERTPNIYQITLFQLYPQDPSLPDGKLKLAIYLRYLTL